MGRLFTDEYLRAGLEGYGLWSMSRGSCQYADAYADGTALPILRIEALHLYQRLLESGPMQHSEIQARLGLNKSSSRDLLALDEGKQVSMRLSEHSITTVFPDLW